MRRILALGLLLALCAQARVSDSDQNRVDRLLTLIDARLQLAPEVARTKWNSHAAIEDLPREKAILDGLVHQAPQYGLEPHTVEVFFQAQIEASKEVQKELQQEWKDESHPPFEHVADLARDIRPKLDALTPQLLTALHDAESVLATPEGQELLEEDSQELLGSVLEQARETAIRPLRRK